MRDGLLPAPFTNLTGIFFLLVLGISAVQLAALYGFFNDYLDWSALFAAPVATLLAGVPLLSSILGIIAAYNVWHWELWAAIALMGAPTILWLTLQLIAFIINPKGQH